MRCKNKKGSIEPVFLTAKKVFACILVCVFILMSSPLPANALFSLEKRQREAKTKIKKLKWLEIVETNKLYKNQRRLEQNRTYLNDSKIRYASTKMRLGQLEAEYNKSRQIYNKNLEQSKIRIREVYKQQRISLLGAVLSATNINTLSDIIYYQNVLMKSDKKRVEESECLAKRLAELKAKIEAERDILAHSISDMNNKQLNIKMAIDKNSTMIEKLRNDRAYYERTERELAKQSARLEENLRKSSRRTSGIHVSTGFSKPISGPITSHFGMRIHPIFGSRTFHTGVDIGGRYGSAVHASNSGRVIFVGWYGGYGKVVIIDHGIVGGSRLTTLYAHLSSYNNTTVGSMVKKGQVIGQEGSTGYSTGPHLHFEVRKNGKPTDPLNYI